MSPKVENPFPNLRKSDSNLTLVGFSHGATSRDSGVDFPLRGRSERDFVNARGSILRSETHSSAAPPSRRQKPTRSTENSIPQVEGGLRVEEVRGVRHDDWAVWATASPSCNTLIADSLGKSTERSALLLRPPETTQAPRQSTLPANGARRSTQSRPLRTRCLWKSLS